MGSGKSVPLSVMDVELFIRTSKDQPGRVAFFSIAMQGCRGLPRYFPAAATRRAAIQASICRSSASSGTEPVSRTASL